VRDLGKIILDLSTMPKRKAPSAKRPVAGKREKSAERAVSGKREVRAKRPLTEFNHFMSSELKSLNRMGFGNNPKDRFKQAIANWNKEKERKRSQ